MGTRRADTVVCGAGIAGVATAYYLGCHHGLWNTVLVDPHAALSGTTSKSGENYRNWWPLAEMAAFTERSITLMEAIADGCANAIQLQPRGYLYVSATCAVADTVDGIAARYATAGPMRVHDRPGLGYDPRPEASYRESLVGADIITHQPTIRMAFPHLSDRITLAVHARRAGLLSVQQMGMFMLDVLRSHGAQLVRGRVVEFLSDGEGVTGVAVERGDGKTSTMACANVVIAAGPFLPELAALADVELPVESVRQQKIAVQDPQTIVPRTAPFTIFMDAQSVAWSTDERDELQSEPDLAWLTHKLPGGLHVRPEGTGDSTWIKLGWALNHASTAPADDPGVSAEFPELVMRGAAAMIPGLEIYRGRLPKSVVHYSGYYTKTAENLPIIGPLGVKGLYGVGALSGYGTMSACAAGELCAAWIAGAPLPAYANLMSPARYTMPEYGPMLANLTESGEL